MDEKLEQHGTRPATPAYTPPAWAYAHYQNGSGAGRGTANRRPVFIAVFVVFWLLVFYMGFNVVRTTPVGVLLLCSHSSLIPRSSTIVPPISPKKFPTMPLSSPMQLSSHQRRFPTATPIPSIPSLATSIETRVISHHWIFTLPSRRFVRIASP